ncbi:DJ-1/PfpI family protein [Nocardioides montaniterrae]
MVGRRIEIVLFEGFELLDVFGPAELFSKVPGLSLTYLAPSTDPVRSAQGAAVVPDRTYADATAPDIVLVPGGIGTRALLRDPAFLDWLTGYCASAELVASVCTGAAVLAAAGLLDGHRATSNKAVFDLVLPLGTSIEWVPQARWVEDGDRWTSSGVAAGMDMAAALIDRLAGDGTGRRIADLIELELHTDPDWDPFAAIHGLA